VNFCLLSRDGNCQLQTTSAVNIEFETDVNNDIFTELKEVRKRHPNQFSCAYLNINSFGYTFCSVKELLTTNTVDMLIIAEAKLDNTFINSQFAVDNYHLYNNNLVSKGHNQIRVCLIRNHVEVDCWFI
jgi:hypothetical protein